MGEFRDRIAGAERAARTCALLAFALVPAALVAESDLAYAIAVVLHVAASFMSHEAGNARVADSVVAGIAAFLLVTIVMASGWPKILLAAAFCACSARTAYVNRATRAPGKAASV